jgi:hypothetical protein
MIAAMPVTRVRAMIETLDRDPLSQALMSSASRVSRLYGNDPSIRCVTRRFASPRSQSDT